MAHFSVASLFQISLLFVFICWTKESTGASFCLEEEFKQLKENYIQMKEIVKNFESKVIELKSTDVQMREKVTSLEDTVTELKATVAQQDSLLSDLLREKNERTAANHIESVPMRSNQSAVAINGLPSSCGDLKMIGHNWSGFYSVMGSAMIESVYCDFSKLPSDPDFQKWIGYVDVKSTPVHFYVQGSSSFNGTGTRITYDLARVNEGNAMNLTSGIFTAPRPGIYFFSFTGLAGFPASSSGVVFSVGLYTYFPLLQDFSIVGKGLVVEGNTVFGQNDQVTVHSTLNLKKDDKVFVEILSTSVGAYLYDDINHNTQFTGFILEEEIVASL